MGVRGELFSTKVSLQNRTYFFNVKENRLGDLYLNIVESKNRDEGGFERQSIILFSEDLQEFLQGFDESLKVLEKSVREKRRSSKGEAAARRSPPRGEEGYGEDRPVRRRSRPDHEDSPPYRKERTARPRSDRDDRGERSDRYERKDRPAWGDRDDRRRSDDGPPRRSAPRAKYGGEKTFSREKPAARSSRSRSDRFSEDRERRPRRTDKDKPAFGPKKRVVVKKR